MLTKNKLYHVQCWLITKNLYSSNFSWEWGCRTKNLLFKNSLMFMRYILWANTCTAAWGTNESIAKKESQYSYCWWYSCVSPLIKGCLGSLVRWNPSLRGLRELEPSVLFRSLVKVRTPTVALRRDAPTLRAPNIALFRSVWSSSKTLSTTVSCEMTFSSGLYVHSFPPASVVMTCKLKVSCFSSLLHCFWPFCWTLNVSVFLNAVFSSLCSPVCKWMQWSS